MASGGLTTLLVFMCMITLALGLAQASINDIAKDNGNTISYCGALFSEASDTIVFNSSSELNTSKIQSALPGGATTAPSGTSGFFVLDYIASASNWIKSNINTFTELLSGPYCTLHSIEGIPPEFVSIISFAWYTIGILLVVGFIFGR